MDLIDSDDEELPTNLDLTGSVGQDYQVNPPTRSTTLTDRTLSQALPPSPKTARKRTNQEIYQRSQIPIASTTPLKSPPKRMPPFYEVGTFGADSHSVEMASPVTKEVPADQNQPAKTFVQDIQSYQDQLENEFKIFEQSLKERNKKDALEDLDWDELEQQYHAEIRPKEADEQAIMEELQTRSQASRQWSLSALKLTSS